MIQIYQIYLQDACCICKSVPTGRKLHYLPATPDLRQDEVKAMPVVPVYSSENRAFGAVEEDMGRTTGVVTR